MHTHELRVRYGEVDMQAVVFNAHYLAWVDDAMSGWLGAVGYQGASWAGSRDDRPEDERGWDFMVRHATLDWHGSATFGDRVSIDCRLDRWGTTSFDVRFTVRVDERPVVTVVLTYVGVRTDPVTGEAAKAPVPARFRALLGEAEPAPA